MFASWDGEEYGGLGSTSWLYRHSKELGSRGVTYINMDHLLQGADDVHVPSSPLLKEVIFQAAKAVSCTKEDEANDSRYGDLEESYLLTFFMLCLSTYISVPLPEPHGNLGSGCS